MWSCQSTFSADVDLLQAVLIELARARLHGFSDREVEIALALEMSEAESMWVERDQIYAEASDHVAESVSSACFLIV